MIQESDVVYVLREGIDELLVYEVPNGPTFSVVLFSNGTGELNITNPDDFDEDSVTLEITNFVRLPGVMIISGPDFEYVLSDKVDSEN